LSDELAKLRRAALDMLARRDYSQAELRYKLSTKSADELLINQIIEELAERNFQSDERFTENFVSFRSRKGFGPIKIIMELRSKGISEVLAKDIIYSEDYDWYDLASTVLEKKFANKTVDIFKKKQFLLNRGFTHDIIHEVVE